MDERRQTETTEALLIQNIRDGNPALFHDLIRPYERRAFLIAWAILRNQEDSEDAVQQGILRIVANLGQLEDPARFPQWAMRIVENEARMSRRRRRGALYESMDGDDEDDAEPQRVRPSQFADWRELPDEALERSEVRSAILDALNSLPKIYREIFVLRDMEHLNVAQTAEVLDIGVPAVKTRLHRARLMMREALAPRFSTPSPPLWKRWKGLNPWFAAGR
jgi:RNA polymerase sigma-70 factor (ECF subfamily)